MNVIDYSQILIYIELLTKSEMIIFEGKS